MFKFLAIMPLALGAFAQSSFASDASEYSTQGLNQLQIEELMQLSDVHVFPDSPILAIDPLTRQKVDQVLVGPTLKASQGSGFDYYRYITYYNVDERKERISSLPIHREECWDKSEFFGSYSYAYTFTATVTAEESIEGLGLSASLSKSQTLTTSRNVIAVGDMQADHIPYMLKQNWSGQTYIETYTNGNHRAAFILKRETESPWWMRVFFPALANVSAYPMPFDVQDADWTFVVERTIIKHCAPSTDNGDTVKKDGDSKKKNNNNLQQMSNQQ